MMKKCFALILALILMLAMGSALADSAPTGGYCGAEGDGTNATWSFDASTGTLTISGTGAMVDYSDKKDNDSGVWYSTAPWHCYKDKITRIEVTGQVTHIGEVAFAYLDKAQTATICDSVMDLPYYAFYRCTALESIKLSSRLESIGNQAFFRCEALKTIEWPTSGSLKTIGEQAFIYNLSLENLVLPSGLESIGDQAFAEGSISTVTYLGETSPTLDWSSTIANAAGTPVTVYVPCTYNSTTFGEKTVTNGHFEAITGNTNLTYTANGNTLTEGACKVCNEPVGHSATATLTLTNASNLIYNGADQSSAVSVIYSDGWMGGKLDVAFNPAKVVNAGTYTASITRGGATAEVTFTIAAPPPQTGDSTPIALWLALLAAGMTGMLVMLHNDKRKYNN